MAITASGPTSASGTASTAIVSQNTVKTHHGTPRNSPLLITTLGRENLSSTKIKRLHKTDRGASSNSCMIHAMLGRRFGHRTATQLRDAISTKLMDWLDFNKDLNQYPEGEPESVTLCRGFYLQMLYQIIPILREAQTPYGDTANAAEFNTLTIKCPAEIATLNVQIEHSHNAVTLGRLIEQLESIKTLGPIERQSLYDSLATLATQENEKAISLRDQLYAEGQSIASIKETAESLCTDLRGQTSSDSDTDQDLFNCLTNKNIVDSICTTMIGQIGKGKFLHATFAPLIHLAVNKVLYDNMKKQEGDREFNSIYDRQEGDTQEEGVAWLHDMCDRYDVTKLPTLVIYSPGSGHNEYDRTTCILGTTQQADPNHEALETQDTNDLADLALLFSRADAYLGPYTNTANDISNRRFGDAATTMPIRRLFINGNQGNHYLQLTQYRCQTSQNSKHILVSIATIVGSIFAHKHIALISLKLGVSVAILSTCIHVLATLSAMYLFNKIHQAHSIS